MSSRPSPSKRRPADRPAQRCARARSSHRLSCGVRALVPRIGSAAVCACSFLASAQLRCARARSSHRVSCGVRALVPRIGSAAVCAHSFLASAQLLRVRVLVRRISSARVIGVRALVPRIGPVGSLTFVKAAAAAFEILELSGLWLRRALLGFMKAAAAGLSGRTSLGPRGGPGPRPRPFVPSASPARRRGCRPWTGEACRRRQSSTSRPLRFSSFPASGCDARCLAQARDLAPSCPPPLQPAIEHLSAFEILEFSGLWLRRALLGFMKAAAAGLSGRTSLGPRGGPGPRPRPFVPSASPAAIEHLSAFEILEFSGLWLRRALLGFMKAAAAGLSGRTSLGPRGGPGPRPRPFAIEHLSAFEILEFSGLWLRRALLGFMKAAAAGLSGRTSLGPRGA
eukprot:tig00000339_g24186.t1